MDKQTEELLKAKNAEIRALKLCKEEFKRTAETMQALAHLGINALRADPEKNTALIDGDPEEQNRAHKEAAAAIFEKQMDLMAFFR